MNPTDRVVKVVKADFDIEQYAKDHPNSKNREGLTAYEEFVAQSKKKHQGIQRTEVERGKSRGYNDLQFDA